MASTISTPTNLSTTSLNVTTTVSRSRAGYAKTVEKEIETPIQPVDLGKFARLRYGNNQELIFNIHCQVSLINLNSYVISD